MKCLSSARRLIDDDVLLGKSYDRPYRYPHRIEVPIWGGSLTGSMLNLSAESELRSL